MPSILAMLGALFMSCCQWLIYIYAPRETAMGIIQKIFYIHLPLAWWALISFFMVFCGSIAYLFRRRQSADNFCGAAAEIGMLFCTLALVTGMIWAKKSWGVWWTWDPRLTTTLVMWFIYAAYLVLRGLEMPSGKKEIVCAVLGIVAFLDVPLVFFSARLFRSIHPAVFASPDGGLPFEMRIAIFAAIASMGLFWAALLWLRKRQLDLNDALDEKMALLESEPD